MAEICKGKAKCEHWHKFFKIMLGNFKHELRIPRKFVENFKGRLSSRCTLQGPSGNVWKVQVIRGDEDVLFSRGWESFVRDHGIENFDFLVFSYVDDSTFEVFVFDGSGCEREGSYFTKVNLSGSSNCSSTLHLKGNNNVVNEEAEMNDDDYESYEEEAEEEPFSDGPRLFKSVKQTQKFHISGRREVSDQEKERACTRADEYLKKTNSCGVPMIGIVMLPTHVYKGLYLTIPKGWAKEYMAWEDHEVELQIPGKNYYWVVGCRWGRVGQCQIRPKWAEFVLDNNLEEGDVCVFELVHRGRNRGKTRPLLKVRIFRVVQEVVPLTPKRIAV